MNRTDRKINIFEPEPKPEPEIEYNTNMFGQVANKGTSGSFSSRTSFVQNKEKNAARRAQRRADKAANRSEINPERDILPTPERLRNHPHGANPPPDSPHTPRQFAPVRYPGIGGSAPGLLHGRGSPYRDALLYSQPRDSTT